MPSNIEIVVAYLKYVHYHHPSYVADPDHLVLRRQVQGSRPHTITLELRPGSE